MDKEDEAIEPQPKQTKGEPRLEPEHNTDERKPEAGEPTVPATPVSRPIHLAPIAADALSLDPEDRVLFARTDRWIPYPKATEAINRATDLMKGPRATAVRGLLVLARSGNGKSTISRRLESTHGPVVGEHGKVTAPVLRVELSPGANQSLFWSDLLTACGAVHRVNEHWIVKREQACSMLVSLEPRALMIDEFHNFLLGPARDARLMVGELKWITNKFSMPLILFGTEDAANLLQYDDQMTRRFKHFALPWWKNNPDLPKVLDSFEALLPLPERSRLRSNDMMRLIEERYDGTIGGLAWVLQEAAVLAIRAGNPRIDPDILEKVWGNTEEQRRAQRDKL